MQQVQMDTAARSATTVPAKAVDAFHAGILDSKAATHWMIDFLHPDGKKCPYCHVEITDEVRLQRWYTGERIKCSSPDCGRFYTSRTNTGLDGSTLDARELFLLKVLIELDVPAAKIVSVVPINKETVSRWAQRFQAMESASA
jgi:transposase-like protein